MSESNAERKLEDLIFIGLSSKVIALDRYNGSVVWDWKSPKSAGFVALMLDGDRLLVGANGYIFCLDPLFGQQVWENPLKGYGVGITSMTSVNGQALGGAAAMIQAQQQAAAAAGGAAAATAGGAAAAGGG